VAKKTPVTIEMFLDAQGNLRIEIPHDANRQRNANAAADFTMKLAKAIGQVQERHIGDHEHHDHRGNHTGNHTHTHRTHNA